ncbi:hypothetical protein E0Z10_g969 [Xylaria hypoxylon]|uniref:Putative transcription factor kapC n=1 Tax=Xylaria hypoxylon TaxID=37992 RepID=A0A4Z0Z8E8_9PEZI|nr:hypothetical protein E0Z10_g969 [Xylaria hypoxylon]
MPDSLEAGDSNPDAASENEAEPLTEAKAKARRQQVRNAQRQHRQRKANYTKQLEMDITNLRDDIARVEQEVETLRNQNGAIRSQLTLGDQAAPVAVDVPLVDTVDMAFSTSLAPDYTVSIDMFEHLGTPAFHVSRASTSLPDTSSKATSSYAAETLSSATPASTVGTSLEDVAMMEMTLSQDQTDQAINFILALEHCCWNHIQKSCFGHHGHPDQNSQPKRPDCNESEPENLNGHALMATTLALQSAPSAVFTGINDLQQQLASAPSAETAAPLAWSSKALTLTNLRRLAGTLNSSDTELAPVQAWFELASRYGVAIATDSAVLEKLKRKLAGEVRCVVFGAAVQRDIFEAALENVIGFLPPNWSADEDAMMDLGEDGEEEEEEEEEEEDTETEQAGMHECENRCSSWG